jgi:MarR family 2-MHQ and catechol resistance regulon transcriptional repressor
MPTRYAGDEREVRALNVFIKLMRAADTVSTALTRSLTPHGLTMGQLGVLEALLHLGSLSQRDLGRKLLRSGANVTTVVDNLERDGLVTRARGVDDRRLVTVSLTARGHALIARIFPGHVQSIARLFEGLSAGEQEELGRLCKVLGGRAPAAEPEVAAAAAGGRRG